MPSFRVNFMKQVGAKICDGECYLLLDMSLPIAPSSHWFERALYRGGWRSALLCPWHMIRSVAYWGCRFFAMIGTIVGSCVVLMFRLWWFGARLGRSSIALGSKGVCTHGRLGILLSALVAVLGDSPMCSLYQPPVTLEVKSTEVNW